MILNIPNQEQIDEVQENISELNNNLTTSDNLKFRFATDGEGNYGYLGADDSFIPFKSGATLIGTFTGNQTIDVSQYLGTNDTVDNFIVEIVSVNGSTGGMEGGRDYWSHVQIYPTTISKSLANNNLTISGATVNVRVYYQASGYQDTNGRTASNITYKLWYM